MKIMGKHKTETLKNERDINAYIAEQERILGDIKNNIRLAERRRELLINIANNQVSMFGEGKSVLV